MDDDLTPRDGLTDLHVRFAGLTPTASNGAVVRFELVDAKRIIGEITIGVSPQPEGTIDAMVTSAYAGLRDIMRQWLHEANAGYRTYSKRQTPLRRQ